GSGGLETHAALEGVFCDVPGWPDRVNTARPEVRGQNRVGCGNALGVKLLDRFERLLKVIIVHLSNHPSRKVLASSSGSGSGAESRDSEYPTRVTPLRRPSGRELRRNP